jgi:beta-lactamase class A
MDRKKIAFVFILALGLGLGIYLSYKSYRVFEGVKNKQRLLEKRKAAWIALEKTLKSEVSNFKGEAAIIIEDLNMGWRISLNEDKFFPSASLVKIPIMAGCFFAVYKGKIALKDNLILKESSKVVGSGILKNMAAGSKFNVEKLIELMITKSDNTATNMLIDLLGFDYLNSFFKNAGLTHTNLSRQMMDFKYRKKGVENYTTAADIAYVLERIYRREFLNKVISDRCLALLLRQKVNDRIPAKLPPQVLVAHKTGLERNVCHDAGIVFTPKGEHFLICVLTESKADTRKVKEFISNVSLYIYNNYQRLPSS